MALIATQPIKGVKAGAPLTDVGRKEAAWLIASGYATETTDGTEVSPSLGIASADQPTSPDFNEG